MTVQDTEPLLTPRKVGVAFLVSVLLADAFYMLGEALGTGLRVALTSFFIIGHWIVAWTVARGRFSTHFSWKLCWDFFAICGVFWVGPVLWYLEWKKRQRANLPGVGEGLS